MNKLEPAITLASLHKDVRHDSGPKHVTGTAEYIDDMVEPAGTMHAYLGLSTNAHAEIINIDFSATKAAPGVIGVLTGDDIPGENDVSPSHKHDEPIFASGKVQFWGQPLFAVIAETRDQARRAAHLVKVTYKDLPVSLDVRAAQAAGGALVTEPLKLERGDVAAGMAAAPRRVKGSMAIGGQDHFYLEGQISMAVPGEDEDVTVFASTQHPSEVQLMVAQVLGIRHHAVTVNVRRMGGGFGGKETQSNLFAAVAALAAKKWNRACKLRPDRDDDMTATGKRHDFVVDYDVGYDDTGKIVAVDAVYGARAGFSSDLSGPVTDRALFHADNAYWYPAVRVRSEPLYTNTVSNTAFRGFGGPQGMLAAERWIEDIAYDLGKDPLEIRKANFYGTDTNNVTPYHQTVADNIVHRVVDELETSSDYQARRAAIVKYNAGSPILKKGIALTPVKFGISFTATWYNQAGALVHVYKDGSIHLSHGGTEMGQGLHTKVAQVLADAFQVGLERIKITATTTGKVPNTSATAASSGSDLNGAAAADAARQIKARLIAHAAKMYEVTEAEVAFEPGGVRCGQQFVEFGELVAS
ncbi:MAG TPA: xanthine dehydrogenase molybdopterin binding subunit, partial [Devosia sp.]|nr:xanthine dehydrogenase molybdopterin binding subunit [Devosia sp.]